MGYTHYWYRKKDFTSSEWATVCKKATEVINEASEKGIEIALDSHDNLAAQPPRIDGDMIRFNGVGRNGHETFVLHRGAGEPQEYIGDNGEGRFNFCKTARKPYDEVVVKVLIAAYLASTEDTIKLSSDGDVFLLAGQYIREHPSAPTR